MKLVEILARELEVWPEGCERISQLSTRGLLIDTRIHDAGLDLAEDWDRSTITRPQWQAERDRMKAMEKQPNVWQQAIDHELVVAHLGVAGDVPHAEAVAKLNSLIDWHVQVATDPAANGGFVLSKEPTYEQQLWDRVYLKAFDEIHEMHPTTLSSADVAYSAADIADAFMAERAKRVGK